MSSLPLCLQNIDVLLPSVVKEPTQRAGVRGEAPPADADHAILGVVTGVLLSSTRILACLVRASYGRLL